MANLRPKKPDAERRGIRGRAIVWKRYDFSETSRIVALLLRDHGVVNTLAKGAHRPTSPLLGRIDFLCELDVHLSSPSEGLRKLLRAELARERRGLRKADRFLCASHLADLCDAALVPGRPDPELFDLVEGGLALVELCPLRSLPVVVLGLELRLLQRLGALPDLDSCCECGASLLAGAFLGDVASAPACRAHAATPRRAIGAGPLAFLRTLCDTKGRDWPELDAQPPATAIGWVGRWLAHALERRMRLRTAVYSRRRANPVAGSRAVDSGA